MHPWATAVGTLLTLVILWDAFQTVILSRRVSRRFRPTRVFYRLLWTPWRAATKRIPPGNRRENILRCSSDKNRLIRDLHGDLQRRLPRRLGKAEREIAELTIRGVLAGLPLTFQGDRSEGLDATYHFTFTGEEQTNATVAIHEKSIQVLDGHHGNADLHVTADSRTWLRLLFKETSIVWALLRRKIRLRGSLRLLQAFGRCFPS